MVWKVYFDNWILPGMSADWLILTLLFITKSQLEKIQGQIDTHVELVTVMMSSA